VGYWLRTEVVCPSEDGHPPGTNRARRIVDTPNVATTTTTPRRCCSFARASDNGALMASMSDCHQTTRELDLKAGSLPHWLTRFSPETVTRERNRERIYSSTTPTKYNVQWQVAREGLRPFFWSPLT